MNCFIFNFAVFIRFMSFIIYLVSRMDRVRNEEVRRRAAIERELASRADQRVLR